jgi:hypothetical protein
MGRDVRTAAGLTLLEIAHAAADVSEAIISRVENGTRGFRRDTDRIIPAYATLAGSSSVASTASLLSARRAARRHRSLYLKA